MPYYLSDKYKEQVDAVIGQRPGTTGGYMKGYGSRLVCHVRITGPVITSHSGSGSAGWYPCVPCVPNSDGTWTEFSEAIVRDPNDGPLVIGDRYGAVRYGYIDALDTIGFVTLGTSDFTGSSLSSGSSGAVEVVTQVECSSGLQVDYGTLTGTVVIGGKSYPVTLRLDTGGSF